MNYLIKNLNIPIWLKYYYSKKLPINYKKLNYIETDGKSYLDSGVLINNNSKLYIKFRTANNIPTNVSTVLFYSGNELGINHGFALGTSSAQGKYRAFYVSGTYTGLSALNTLTDYEILYDKNKFILDNELKYTFNMVEFVTPFTMPFFAQYFKNDTIAINYATSGTRIYEIKIWDNDKIIRHMVPCKRKEDNVIGMFDTVTGTFFGNLGTGEFIGGE